MEHLIIKYLNNELSQEEWQELRQWLEKSDLNKTTLNNLKSFSSNITYEAEELEELVWQELRGKRQVHSIPESGRDKRPVIAYFKVAAVIFIVAALSLITYRFTVTSQTDTTMTVAMKVKEAPMGQKITTRLPDGSVVMLNAGSGISFPEQFTGSSREVNLNGEAFFEVKHNPEKPFCVNMNGDRVRVLGTSFNIRSYPEDSAVYVSVATGRVSYRIPSGEEVILEPEQVATYIPAEDSLLTGEVDELQAFGWKDQIIYFKSTAFDNIIKELERWYGVDIDVQGDYKHIGTFSGEFRNETLFQVLKGLSFIYQFDFKIEGSQVSITEKVTP